MKLYVRTAVAGFTICFCLSLVYLANVVPWIIVPVTVKAAFACLAALYLPLFAGVLVQVCQRKYLWPRTKSSIIGGFFLGMTLGLFTSGSLAVFGDHGLEWFHKEGLDSLLYGGTQETTFEQLRVLLPRAEVLGMLKTFIACCIQTTLSFGFAAVLVMGLYDLAKAEITKRRHIYQGTIGRESFR